MRVLAVTGKLAEKDVRRYAVGADILVVDIDVAAFITPKHLEREDLSGYDLVLVPGLTSANWERLEKEKNVKIRLGPIHAYDLQFLMPLIGEIELSHTVPACRLIKERKKEEILSLVGQIQDYKFSIGNVPVGGKSRMKVVAEVVDATKLGENELARKIRYYEKSGADIIDLGLPLEVKPEEVELAIDIARKATDLPLSVDTFDIKAIEAAIDAGIDMVMSISQKNEEAIDLIDGQAVVVVERDVKALLKLLGKVREKTEKVIADPVLDPPLRLAESILRYRNFRELDKETPMLFGVGNVTELADSDSIGINAILAFIAEELQANLLFTTEASPKTAGSVRELSVASYMAKAAKLRNTAPKDLGLDLLVLKEKVRLESCSLPENALNAEESEKFIRDPFGDFRVWISEGKIVCSHERLTVVGRNAKEIYDTVLRNKLISRLDHACYLGKELMKAEIALMLGKNYTQDQDLNFGIYSDSLEDGEREHN
ncbi:MAG: dihydropteroate synthase-like protein [Archaeoglobus sp.]|nr:dihydropteroate synthase-like protein [Archaeoglobus sp.]